MIGFLRFVGVVNAAVWLGAAAFFTAVAGPGFASEAMIDALSKQPYYATLAAQVFAERYFVLQYWCAGIALVHLFAERLYLGRPFGRVRTSLLAGILLLTLLGGLWVQPKLRGLHQVMHRSPAVEERQRAAEAYRVWKGVSQVNNLLATVALLAYLWRVVNSPELARFASLNKFRG